MQARDLRPGIQSHCMKVNIFMSHMMFDLFWHKSFHSQPEDEVDGACISESWSIAMLSALSCLSVSVCMCVAGAHTIILINVPFTRIAFLVLLQLLSPPPSSLS